MQFGRRSERLDPDQLALGLEDLDGDIAREEESRPRIEKQQSERSSHRKPLPDHLPREDVRLDIDDMTCACCGGALHVIGESVSEMLDWIPAQLRVIRTTRPKYACRTCETVVQAPAPERVIAGGLATPALLAQVLVSKYCDHTPLYRQSQIFARHGVDLPRSTLAGWVGGACWWLEALHERLCKNVFASDHLFADDTPVPVLDPGRGRTKTGRLWVYARDQRGWGGPEPPAAVYLFAPDRKAERPASHLEDFKGVLHVDGYAGFEPLTEQRRRRARRMLEPYAAKVLRGGAGHQLADRDRSAAPDRRALRHRSRGPRSIARAQARGAPQSLEAHRRGDEALVRSAASPCTRPQHAWPKRSATRSRAGTV